MRIRGSPAAAAAASSEIESPCPLASPSIAAYTSPTTSITTNQTTSSSSSCFSSSTHSTISTHSLTSSSNSASCSSYATDSPRKCEGLDLLVKAVYYVVAGSVIGVPYIQRRVIRRRKRALNFSSLIVGGSLNSADDEVKLEEDVEEQLKVRKSKRRKTVKGELSPWKLQESVVFQSWKPPTAPTSKPAASSRSRRRRGGRIPKGGSR